jgi:hypothetical protein
VENFALTLGENILTISDINITFNVTQRVLFDVKSPFILDKIKYMSGIAISSQISCLDMRKRKQEMKKRASQFSYK